MRSFVGRCELYGRILRDYWVIGCRLSGVARAAGASVSSVAVHAQHAWRRVNAGMVSFGEGVG